jgi:hypothetical protein
VNLHSFILLPQGSFSSLQVAKEANFINRYLENAGFDTGAPAGSLNALANLVGSVVSDQKALENYGVKGLVGSWIAQQDLVSFASELNYGVNGSIIDTATSVPIVYSDDFAGVLSSLITAWLDTGLIASSDLLGMDSDAAFNAWAAGNAVVLRATDASVLAKADKAGIAYTTWPLPRATPSKKVGVAALKGYYLAVNARSPVLDAAVKAVEFLTSLPMQRYVLVNGLLPIAPAYPSLLSGTNSLSCTYYFRQPSLCCNGPRAMCNLLRNTNRPASRKAVPESLPQRLGHNRVNNAQHACWRNGPCHRAGSDGHPAPG